MQRTTSRESYEPDNPRSLRREGGLGESSGAGGANSK